MNEKREDKREIQKTKSATETIISELKTNLEILERWTPYHKNIYNTGIDSVLTNTELMTEFNLGQIPDLDKGIQREIITTNGLTLIEDNRVNIDIKTRMDVNRLCFNKI